MRDIEGFLYAAGVDISFAKLQKAQQRLHQGKAKHIGFINGDAENLSCIRPDVFDTVLCSELIEHVLDR